LKVYDVSAAEARRIALVAQGFADRPPNGAVDARLIRRVLGRIGLLQIDSVNVLVRTQYLPLFARLGPYPATLLESLAYERRELFEYWGHEASFLPMPLHPLMRWRMTRYASGTAGWTGMRRFAQEYADPIERVYQFVAERGPVAAGALEEPGARSGPWWGWSEGKRALEWLYSTGRLAVAHRRNFERHYDLPERVYPADVLALPTPSEEDAVRELIRIASRAHGIGTVADLADYFRIRPQDARPRIAELVEAGELQAVRVEAGRIRPTSTRGRRSPAACGRGRCSRRSTRWSGSARAPSGCSTSTCGWRSTRPLRSESSGTTCCRSWSARRWSGGWT
jgi:uncharacterized protein YcaQ